MDPNMSMSTYDAIVFPADARPPHIAALVTSPLTAATPADALPFRCGRVPHPEVYMDYIADQASLSLGSLAWGFHVRPLPPLPTCRAYR